MLAPEDTNEIVGRSDILWIVLDTLRFDVAERALADGQTPNLARHLGGWERRHTPASFTLPAHQAFFAGFLPTPARPGRHPRRFALRFDGSETTTPGVTCVLDGPDIVHGLAERGYHTACIGGVGFFNQRNPLGRVLPGYFAERHWSEATGVTDPRSFERQIDIAETIAPRAPRLFLFVNVAALHQPNHVYLPGATTDTPASQAAALAYVDRHIPRLFEAMSRRGSTFVIVCSDHGTAYGEDGYHGHRLAHAVVWDVPYAEAML